MDKMKSFNRQCNREATRHNLNDTKYPDVYWQNRSVEEDETPTTQTPCLFTSSVIFSDKWDSQGRVGQLD